jgi:hypothetical protein
VDHYFEQSKEYYATLINDVEIKNIIGIIVDTINVNATKSSRGANKKSINKGSGIYYIFELYKLIEKANLEKVENHKKKVPYIGYSTIGEVFGFYNLVNKGFIYNGKVSDFIRLQYNVTKVKKPSDISKGFSELREKYLKYFNDNLNIDIINQLINDELPELNEGQIMNVQTNMQIDQFIHWLSEQKEKVVSKDSRKKKGAKDQEVGYSVVPLNQILYGPPGTGKTYKTIDISVAIIEGDTSDDIQKIINEDKIVKHKENVDLFNNYLEKDKVHFVTFHQNYSYEEFVGGIRPIDKDDGNLQFKWKPGIFVKACSKALKLAYIEDIDPDIDLEDWFFMQCENYNKNNFKYKIEEKVGKVVLIIDEINRANISRVFGELITLIEDDKRIGGEHQLILKLPNGNRFGVPKNLIIIGTMNTADKSLALLDVALRRRFVFKGLYPNKGLIKEEWRDDFERFNINIRSDKSINYQIGHSYFMKGDLEWIMNNKVLPLLNEYYMENSEKIINAFSGTSWKKYIKPEHGILKYDSKNNENEEIDNQNN